MTIGGYKFKGYHYTLPSDYTSADRNQELLRMFKCRLSAFFDSCQLSGANWVPMYQGNGTYDFYGYQKIIFEISNSDPTYAVFFKYSNEENYLVLVSENCAMSAVNADGYYYYVYNNARYYNHDNDSSAVSLIQLTPENFKTASSNRLSLRGVYPGGSTGSQNARNPLSVNYGFATKNKDVIEFYNSDASSSWRCCKVMSSDAFSLLCNPDDHFGLFSTVCAVRDNSNSSGTTATYNAPLITDCQLLRNTGEEYTVGGQVDGSSSSQTMDIHGFADRMSFYNYASDYVPYVSPVITNNTLRSYGADQLINTNGIYSKGLIRSELLAINSPAIRGGQSLGIAAGNTYANGNYLCIRTLSPYYSSAVPQLVQGAVYCGWDPSNPPITQNTSYIEYTD